MFENSREMYKESNYTIMTTLSGRVMNIAIFLLVPIAHFKHHRQSVISHM